MSNAPAISVVIPVRNEAARIRACIEGILAQTVRVREVIVLDSGSTDGTLEILAEYTIVRVIPVDPADFNHGETRNAGVRAAEGAEFVLLTVGDARPVDELWIERLLAGFTDDRVAGVCGQQVVPHERWTNPVEWFRPMSEPRTRRYQFDSPEAFEALPAAEKRQVCAWDDVTALYRREVLLRIPFEPVTYAEDAVWARAAVRAGYAITYAENARVYHFHVETSDFTFKRTLTAAYFRYRQFGDRPAPPPTLFNVLRATRSLLREPSLSWAGRLQWIGYNARNQWALRRSVLAFNAAVDSGDAALEALHKQYCSKPPVPTKQAASAF